ncbi:MAG: undecaprenyl-phosphate glucose phosphotransferase [Gemmataceae bacterium]
MIDRRSQVQSFGFFLSDLTLTAAVWLAAYYVRFQAGWFAWDRDVPPFYWCWRQLPLLTLLAAVAYRLAGMYQIGRLRRFREEVLAVGKGTALLSLFLLSALFFLQDPYESRGNFVLFAAGTLASVLAARRAGWSVLRRLRANGYNRTQALIVGTGRAARQLAKTLHRLRWLGIVNAGFVEERRGPLSADLPVLGGFDDLPRLIAENAVSHVFIALPFNRYEDVRRVFGILSRTNAEVRLVPDVPSMAGLSLTTTQLDGTPVIGLRESQHFGINVVVKRVMDVVLACVALCVFGPLMAVIALIIKLTSPGPVLFTQRRCGLNGETFAMLKFRSMRVDAEDQTGAVWAKKGDDRRTWIGRIIRPTSLDELPQLFNVLRGDMSLVGPRPERPEFIADFAKSIPFYMARHGMKAGMTGWAQVNGWRGNTSLRKRVQYDLHYITHWTPVFDVRILWLTVFRGFMDKNAY